MPDTCPACAPRRRRRSRRSSELTTKLPATIAESALFVKTLTTWPVHRSTHHAVWNNR